MFRRRKGKWLEMASSTYTILPGPQMLRMCVPSTRVGCLEDGIIRDRQVHLLSEN